MPTYELTLILKQFKGPALNTVLRRISRNVWDRKGLIRDIQYMGTRQTPVMMYRNNEKHWKAMYWLYTFDAPTNELTELFADLLRDVDVLRNIITKIPNEETPKILTECRLEEESLPPAYRQDVKDMMEKGKRPVRSRQL